MIKNILINAFSDALFPPRCLICNDIIEPTRYFCKKCENTLEPASEERCLGCGLAVKRCECNRFIYHFDGIISPFYNKGSAQNAYYSYKFKKNKRGADFFSQKIVETINQTYSNCNFDCITWVCASSKKNDFDHAKILANKISKRSGIKLRSTLKPSGKKREVQHTLSFSGRFENVRNTYDAISSLKGQSVLLIDDIKTSGATIDECARQLKLAGAEKVFCACALIGMENRD